MLFLEKTTSSESYCEKCGKRIPMCQKFCRMCGIEMGYNEFTGEYIKEVQE